jgi:hypothetical protein|tara:strand:+ start:1466 stop:2083 length:618 start_codon:yes stop_codon:yes gene_type:complete
LACFDFNVVLNADFNADTPMLTNQHIALSVQQWVNTFVVDLNLCPFAKRELVKDRVRFVVSDANNEEALLLHLHAELERLENNSDIETTLLIHPLILNDFDAYNQFLDNADGLLQEMQLDGVFQIASFHPAYQFGGTDIDDAENYTNRSPYPMLHILREASLDAVLATTEHTDQIPVRNIALMNEMGAARLKQMLSACADERPKA